MVDVISSEGWLKPALLTMQLSQMVVQGMWITNSQLLQLPYFDEGLVQKCKQAGVMDLADLMDMEDEARDKLLKFNQQQMQQVAEACNRYPSISMQFEKPNSEELIAGERSRMAVVLSREGEEVAEQVHAPYYPKVLSPMRCLVFSSLNRRRKSSGG